MVADCPGREPIQSSHSLRGLGPKLELKPKLRRESASPRFFQVKVDRTKAIILPGQIQYPENQLGLAARKAVPSQHIPLPEICGLSWRVVAVIALMIPSSLKQTEEAAGVLINRV